MTDAKQILGLAAATLAAVVALVLPTPAAAALGFEEVDLTISGSQAGVHPEEVVTTLQMNTVVDVDEEGEEFEFPDEQLKNLEIDLPAGFAGNPTAMERCPLNLFVTGISSGHTSCSNSTVVGYVGLKIEFDPFPAGTSEYLYVPVHNLFPPPGKAAKMGFLALGVPVTFDLGVRESPPYNVYAQLSNISQAALFYGSALTVWGNPADADNNALRGTCLESIEGAQLGEPKSNGKCSAGLAGEPLATATRSCAGPRPALFSGIAWNSANAASAVASVTGRTGCAKLGFAPEIAASPTAKAAASPSGLDFSLDLEDNQGLTSPTGLSDADVAKTVVTLPEGMTVNPAQAEGLETCSEAELARETAFSVPGEGCPQASKIGTIEAETPLLEEQVLKGSLFVAEPYRNPFGTLIALYVAIQDRELGIRVVQPLKVEPDPRTGQLVTTADEMPEVPFSHFRLHFREGAGSPLITPPGCGTHTVEATIYPSSGGAAVEADSEFEIISGPGGSACPSGTAPFAPGFESGTRNNAAGSHSPFDMRITRADGEQDITKFSAVLPRGVTARIAGIPWCPEAGIARAKARAGENGGQAELSDPSCPAASQIGTTLAGAGAGSQLTYVPGSLYLAGPYSGAPLSVVAIVPAVAGPFDAGTVVVRVGLKLNPRTGQAEADGAASDPIPHILQGIPLNVRDLRVRVDRPQFTLNATSCVESNTFATLWGGGTALLPLPDSPVALASRYQAASCASLGFGPRLAIRLRGGVRRGAHPALRAVVTPRPGQANFSRAVVTLPRSAFLDQGHIRTICTRVQFAAGPGNGALCPKGARYGYARAWSPLLDAPARGPVFLRSSDNNLPDLVVALKGPASAAVDVELSARIDSVRGGIRSTFTAIPDLPVSRFVLDMQGGKKGLIVNSRNLCFKPGRNRARSNIRGQNGRFSRTNPRVVALTCAKRRKAKRKRAKRASLSAALIAGPAASPR